jgi:hypothetical protein
MAGSRLDRAAVRGPAAPGRRRWGFPPGIAGPLVAHLGAVRALHWTLGATRRFDRAMRTLGPLRTHLACVAISLVNGCRYCAHAHAQRRGAAPPGPARPALPRVRGHGRGPGRACPATRCAPACATRCCAPDLHVEQIWVDRALELADGGQPIDEQETRMAHLVGVLDTLNAVGVVGDPPLDEAHDPLNKDTRLKTRLAALRSAEQR